MTTDPKKDEATITELLVLLPFAMVRGLATVWAILKLAEWFVWPLGVPAIGFWHLYGLLTLYALLKNRTSDTLPIGSYWKVERSWWAAMIVCLTVGYAAHWMMLR